MRRAVLVRQQVSGPPGPEDGQRKPYWDVIGQRFGDLCSARYDLQKEMKS